MDRIRALGEVLDAIRLGFIALEMPDPESDRLVFRAVNPHASTLTRLPLERVLGKSIDEAVPSVRAAGLVPIYASVARGGPVQRIEEALIPSDPMAGEVFRITAFPIEPGIVGLAFDNITANVAGAQRIRFQSMLLEAVGQAVIAATPDGMITYMNPEAERLYGVPVTEAVGTSIVTFIAYERGEEILRRAAAGSQVTEEVNVINRNGRAFPVQLTVSPLRDVDGRITGIVGVSADISERIAYEGALLSATNELEERVRARTDELRSANVSLRALIDASPFAIITYDQDARVLSWNGSAARIFGFAPDEVIGRPCPTIEPDQAEMVRAMFGRLAAGEPGEKVREARRMRKDGSLVEVRIHLTRLEPDEGAAQVMALVEDVTVERRMREAAARSERQIAVLNSVTDALHRAAEIEQVIPTLRHELHDLEVDAGMLSVDLGGGHEERFSWELGAEIAAMLLTASDEDGPPPEVAREFPSLFAVPVVSRGDYRGRAWFLSRTASAFDADAARVLSLIAGGIGVAVENIVLFRSMRAAIERAQELSHQAATIRESERRHLALELHDQLGQSLTALKLSLEAAGRVGAPAADHLRSAARLVSDLIAGVRDVSLSLRAPTLQDDLAAELRSTFDSFSRATGIAIEFDFVTGGQPVTPDVQLALYRVAQEALTNVARHANVDRARVTLRAEDDRVTLTVEDEGSGFDVAGALAGGTCGLSGIRERVASLRGVADIESSPGEGTRVRATLPRKVRT